MASAVNAGAPARAAHSATILFVMCLGVLLAQLDSSIVNLITPQIRHDLGASVSELQWVIDAYNLTYAVLLLTGGTLGDLYGRTRMFVVGMVLIGLGSVVCALAPNVVMLIAGRAIAGMGAALELPASLAILTVTYSDDKERGRAIGIWASCNGLALAIGPTVGGVIVDVAGWRTVFFMIVPLVGLAVLMAIRWVGETRDPADRHLDPLGQVLAIVTLASIAVVTIEGPHWGWRSPMTLGLALLALGAGVAFGRLQAGRASGLMPLDMFHNTAFCAALAVAGCMTFGMYALLFLTPLYLQSVGGLSAFGAGLALLPMSLTFVVVSQCSGALMKRFGARAMMAAGMGAMGAGLLALTLITVEPNLWLLEGALLVIGAGLGLNTGPVNAVAVANASEGRSGTASGLINTTRMVGATLGIATLGAVFASYAATGLVADVLAGLRAAFAGGGVVELVGAGVALAFVRFNSMKRTNA